MPEETEGRQSADRRPVEDLESLIRMVKPETAAVLDRALSGEDITPDEAVGLFGTEGQE